MITVINLQYVKEKLVSIYRADGPHLSRGASLSGASVYFKTARSASQSLNVPSSIKEGQTTGWININSDNDNKRCVSKITFSGHTVNSSDMARLKVIGDD